MLSARGSSNGHMDSGGQALFELWVISMRGPLNFFGMHGSGLALLALKASGCTMEVRLNDLTIRYLMIDF